LLNLKFSTDFWCKFSVKNKRFNDFLSHNNLEEYDKKINPIWHRWYIVYR
jgi:lysylphosphatidylglycerol synthetase-like protein (DUF2156 family)